MRTLGEIQPGQTVGRYEFLVPIAQGGMAAVWAARLKGSRGFSKTVAVKTMLPGISDDPQFEQMFLDEAQICSRIRHPNVVEILDLGEQDDLLYLVMEWVDGEPLSVIRRAASKANDVPRPIAVKIVADACAGLHAAHELKNEAGEPVGLVHRDISPQNILITFDGVVKIVDFGVAKAAGRTVGNTNAGQIKGKPPYMSPEQALGQSIDRRTDLFALGIILYQLTTGKHPFRGETDVITLQNIVSDRPIIPPRAYDREYPKPLEVVLLKALERDPDKRYQTAAEFEAALDRVFPPTVPRVRTEDVGNFVRSLLGERGDKRRKALREAIRAADERAQGAAQSTPPGFRPFQSSHPSLVSSSGVLESQRPDRSSGSFRPGAHSEHSWSGQLSLQTPYGTQTLSAPPTPPRSRTPLWLASLVLVLGALAGGAAWLMRHRAPIQVTSGPASPGPPAAAAAPSSVVPAVTPSAASSGPASIPSSEVVEPSQLAVEKVGAQHGHYAWHRPSPSAAHRLAVGAAKPAVGAAKPAVGAAKPAAGAAKPAAGTAKSLQPAASSKPAPTKTAVSPASKPPSKGGFVPPPVTNPGF